MRTQTGTVYCIHTQIYKILEHRDDDLFLRCLDMSNGRMETEGYEMGCYKAGAVLQRQFCRFDSADIFSCFVEFDPAIEVK